MSALQSRKQTIGLVDLPKSPSFETVDHVDKNLERAARKRNRARNMLEIGRSMEEDSELTRFPMYLVRALRQQVWRLAFSNEAERQPWRLSDTALGNFPSLPSTLEQVPILARFCVAELVHAVGHRECPHIFDPEVSDCAARRGTSDLVDLGRFRDALQCCQEMNPRAFSTVDTCVYRHTHHQSGSFRPAKPCYLQACSKLPFFLSARRAVLDRLFLSPSSA